MQLCIYTPEQHQDATAVKNSTHFAYKASDYPGQK